MSDGPSDNGTGVPYLYMTDLDLSGKDVLVNNNVTIMCSLAETDYCKSKTWDPQDPRCAKVIITGKYLKVDKASAEYTFGENSLYEKHPSMRYWPKRHGFYVAKIDIQQVIVLDHFGGAEFVPLDKYFDPDIMPRLHVVDFEEVMLITVNGV
ncbi:creg1 protein [Holotrichia oblita]|uniref:Creg1 protein n=1 Tax=Holotrichia oblita TaxID=644536 RepID=A0ACB9ST18_HOLOL|nr:creg1 protein [Holotrichia oblita]